MLQIANSLKRNAFMRWVLRLFHDLQLVRGQNLLDLVPRVDSPGADRVQLGVGTPVAEGLARLARLLKSQGQVVMGVGIGWSQGNRGLISADGFGEASGFIEHVAQVEVSQSILEIDLD